MKAGESWEVDKLREEHFQPKWLLNGFPKSGLHWLVLLMAPMAKPQYEQHDLWHLPWAGTFKDNSWSLDTAPLERVTYKMGRLQDGRFLKSHSGYSKELERFLWYLGVAHVFIYRDMRDVAVSQAHHVLAEDDGRWAHADKDHYRAMGSFENVLAAVIEGTTTEEGTVYPGVMDRWSAYAPWLDVDWICKVRYEDLEKDGIETAKRILHHGLARASTIFGLEPVIVEDALTEMAGRMIYWGHQTEHSVTFRKGGSGGWKEHFTPELCELFAETDKESWLVKLGYATEGWWKGGVG